MKVSVLYDVWEEEPAPPEAPPAKPRKGKPRPRRRHPKLDREQVFDALGKLGHEPFYQMLDGTDATLVSVVRGGADLTFNLTESYAGDDTCDMNIAAFLDLLGRAYTGAGPHALYLAQDKALAKKIFQFHGIKTPVFALSYKGKLPHAHDIGFPLIVKPTSEDGSIGIDCGSVVSTVKELMARIEYIQERFDTPALIEEYIEGRELYVGILGNGRPTALPPVELDLSQLPEGMPKIAGTEVKWETDTEAYKKTKASIAGDLDEDTIGRLQETALAAYEALELRDYGRIDMRLRKDGEVFVIEANPNPWLAANAEFAMAARESGRSYTQLIGEIVDLARARAA